MFNQNKPFPNNNNNQNPGNMMPNPNDVWMEQVASLAAKTVMEIMSNQQNMMNPGNSGPSNINIPAWDCNTNQNFHTENPYRQQGFKKFGSQFKNNFQNNKFTPYPKPNGSSNNCFDYIGTAVNSFMKGIIKYHYVRLNKPIPSSKFQAKLMNLITNELVKLCPASASLKEIRQIYYTHIRKDEAKFLDIANLQEDNVNENLKQTKDVTDDEDGSAQAQPSQGNCMKSGAHKVMDLMRSLLDKGQKVKNEDEGNVQLNMCEVDQVLSDAIENGQHDVQIDFNLKLTSFPASPPLNELKELLKYFKVTAMNKTDDKTYVISCDAHTCFDKSIAANDNKHDASIVETNTPLPEELNTQMDENLHNQTNTDSSGDKYVKQEKDSEIMKEIKELLAENENEIGDDW